MIYKRISFKDSSKLIYYSCTRNILISSNIYQNADCFSKSKQNFTLQSLNLKSTIQKSIKNESFIKRAFFGELDKEYLKFPKLAKSKDQIKLLQDQYNFICQNITPSNLTKKNLENIGFYNLDEFTLYELSYLFEAIGASFNSNTKLNYFNSNSGENLVPVGENIAVTDSFLISSEDNKSFVRLVLPLIIHNSLVCSTLNLSSTKIKQRILPESRIAFAFCEPDDNFVSLPYPFWNSSATYNNENNSWTINGTKSRILKDDYDYFIVYCKTTENNGDYGIESFLIPRNLVSVDSDGYDNHGTEYLKIHFNNVTLPDDMHRLSCKVDSKSLTNQTFAALNVKARGQLVTSAVILGIIKESTRNLAKLLQNTNKMPGKNIIEEKLSLSTQLIYGLESMLYQTCNHFDMFDENHHDLFLEAMIVKILASEYAQEIMNMLRFVLDCQQMSSVVSSGVTDLLNVLDSFLDSSTSNRLLLATYGLKSLGEWNFDHVAKMRLNRIYSKHFFKFSLFSSYKKKVLQRSKTLMKDYKSLKTLHPSLTEAANSLETVLKIGLETGDNILINYGKDCVHQQIDLNRFASILMGSFQMVSVISRTNDSFAGPDPYSDNKLFICREICRRQLENAKQNQDLINGILDTSVEKRSKAIHKRNIRFDGYFARPTFDRII